MQRKQKYQHSNQAKTFQSNEMFNNGLVLALFEAKNQHALYVFFALFYFDVVYKLPDLLFVFFAANQ